MPIPANLYLYADEVLARRFFSRNLVAPRSVLFSASGAPPPLSFLHPDSLFVTHLSVSPENRNLGDGLASGMRFPVTLEIQTAKALDGNRPILLVEKAGKGGLAVAPGTWNDYDKKKHVGAFLFGEIPLARVKSLWFETAEDAERFPTPSPDFWFPKEKIKVFPKRMSGASPLGDEQSVLDLAASAQDRFRMAGERLRAREKIRAAMLLFVHGTRDWSIGDWKTGVDAALQRFAGLGDGAVSKAVPGWSAIVAASTSTSDDTLPWEKDAKGSDSGPDRLYRASFAFLAKQAYRIGGGGARTAAEMVSELRTIAEEEPSFSRELDAVARFLAAPTDGPNLPQLLAELSSSAPICTALLMLSRTPNDVGELLKSIEVYRVGQCAARQALVLWGALNGLHGVPGKGCGKDNETLWAFVEAKAASAVEDTDVSLVPASPPEKTVLKGKRLLDSHDLRKDEIIRGTAVFELFNTVSPCWKKGPDWIADKVRAMLISEEGPAALDAYSSLDIGKLLKDEAKSAKGTVSRAGWTAFLEKLRERGLKAMSVDTAALCRDWFANKERFAKLWRADRAFWEDAYRKLRPKPKVTPKKKPSSECSGSAPTGNDKSTMKTEDRKAEVDNA